MIEHVIFDWSGVISDNRHQFFGAVRYILRECGKPELTDDEIRDAWIQPYMAFWAKLYPDLDIKRENQLYSEFMERQPPANVFPGVPELLHACRTKGKTLHVLSSDEPKFIEREEKRFGIRGVFTEIHADEHDKTATMQDVAKRHDLRRANALFVGDTTHEIEAGKAAGVRTAGVTWGVHREDKLRSASPDYIAHTAEELGEIINKERKA